MRSELAPEGRRLGSLTNDDWFYARDGATRLPLAVERPPNFGGILANAYTKVAVGIMESTRSIKWVMACKSRSVSTYNYQSSSTPL